MKNKKVLIIISLIVCILLLGGITTYLLLNNTSSSLLSLSNSKASTDESGIDWSKYNVYDVKLGSGNVNITKAGVYNLTGTLKSGSIIVSTNDNVKSN